MALLFVKSIAAPVTSAPLPEPFMKEGFTWDAWYQKNKARLSEKRAKRYRDDPSYREKALQRSRAQREKTKAPITDGHTVSFTDAARLVDVSVWVLREWRRKNYFPEPHRREGRLWFTPSQVSALTELKAFFQTHGIRVGDSTRPALESLVALVFANW